MCHVALVQLRELKEIAEVHHIYRCTADNLLQQKATASAKERMQERKRRDPRKQTVKMAPMVV